MYPFADTSPVGTDKEVLCTGFLPNGHDKRMCMLLSCHRHSSKVNCLHVEKYPDSRGWKVVWATQLTISAQSSALISPFSHDLFSFLPVIDQSLSNNVTSTPPAIPELPGKASSTSS